jgi:hypothetical protein
MHISRKAVLVSLFLVSIFSTLFLAACSGPTLIDVNIDPTTGSGQIVVNPPAEQPTAAPATGGSSSTDMSQVALFAIVVILLLGVMAIVFSVARRPRREQ